MGLETIAILGAGAVAGGLAAGTSSRSDRTQTQTTNQTPWQGDQLNAGFNHARALFDEYQNRQPYTGPTSAPQNQATRDGISQLLGAAKVNGQALENASAASAQRLLQQGGNFVANANDLARNGAAPANTTAQGVLTRAANGALAMPTTAAGQAGQAAATAALTGANALTARANTDPAAAALAAGNNYANSAATRGQIDAAAADITRNFNENTAPGLNARASAGGNLNSARAGIGEAVARRDAGTEIANASAALRANAFNTGAQASLEGNSQQNTLALGANQQRGALGTSLLDTGEAQRQFNAGTQIQGATTLGAQDTANRSLEANTRLEGTQMLGQGALSGFDAAQAAGDIADNNASRLLTAGGLIQAEDQRRMDEERDNYYRNYNYQRGLTDDFLSSVSGNYGGSSTATATQGAPNIMQGILGGAMMGGGILGATRGRSSVGSGTFTKS